MITYTSLKKARNIMAEVSLLIFAYLLCEEYNANNAQEPLLLLAAFTLCLISFPWLFARLLAFCLLCLDYLKPLLYNLSEE